MINKVRVRFAPSPTGPLHIGGVRTALFNYLFAKKHNGTFILRIEDTDQKRLVSGAEDYIVESLNWLNIPFDEGPGKGNYGPYRQSERKSLYGDYIRQLLASGNAYYAFDTPEKLDFHRKDHEQKGKTFIYNWHNRLKLDNSLSMDEAGVQARIAKGEPYVVRFKTPENETLIMNDLIRGEISVNTQVLDDKVLFKSDGMPTYHLANVVDDHLMEISHVIRGEEWIPSLPLHTLLYRAFGWEAPLFAHLPLILKHEGKGKLSKRDGDKHGFPVFPLAWKNESETTKGYREEGYFSEALVNMLALLGWNEGDGSEKEIYSLKELVAAFSLEHVSKSGAKFNPDKTNWFNQQYLQNKSSSQLSALFKQHILGFRTLPVNNAFLIANAKHLEDDQYIEQVINLIKDRASFVKDLIALGKYFFIAPSTYNEKAIKKSWKEDTPSIMSNLVKHIDEVQQFDNEHVELKIKEWINQEGLGFGKVMPPLRLAIVGAMEGPDLFQIMTLIGKNETIARINRAIREI